MTPHERPTSQRRPEDAGGPRRARIALVLALLLLGLALRLAYAYHLPLGPDEGILIAEAREVSIAPHRFNLPLVGDGGRHPALVVWLIAAASWIAGGSQFGMQCVFVLLHAAGLLGLFLLAQHLFGYRAGVLALALGVLDRFWVTSSPQMLEPASFFLAPWILLVAYQCVHGPFRARPIAGWIVLGILLAAANFYYEISILLGFPVAFLLVASPAGRKALRTPGPYVAAAISLSVIAAVQAWNARHGQGGTLRYSMGVFDRHSIVALSPRVLLLYLSDLILPFRDASILALESGDEFFAPIHIPCHWLAGLCYLAGVAWSLRFWRDKRVAFLLVAFFSAALPVSLVPPKELWSNIHYGGLSVVAPMVLSGWIGDRLLERRAGKVLVALALAYLSVSILFFLRGPKWGYPGPDKEMALVGKVYYYAQRHAASEGGMTDEDKNAIHRLNDEMRRTHPDSLVLQHMRSQFAANDEEKIDAIRQAKRIDPYAPLTAILDAARMRDAGNLAGARDCLKAAFDRGRGATLLRMALVDIEFALGNYDQAAQYAQQVLKERPGYSDFYETLGFIYDAQGKTQEAQRAFDSYRYWSRMMPAEAHLRVARGFVERGKFAKAVPYAEEALRLAPQSSNAKLVLGIALAELGELDRAEKVFRDIASSEPTYGQAQTCLEQIRIDREKAGANEE